MLDLKLIVEFAPGGDLRLLLENLGALEEKAAAFYFAEMLLAVNTLHSLGFIHRDIKPSNFVIDKHGHLKLIEYVCSRYFLTLQVLVYLKMDLMIVLEIRGVR